MSERARPRPSPRPTSPENLSLSLSPHALDALADAVAERVAVRLADLLHEQRQSSDSWLDSKQAASYLGVSLSTVHRLTAARAIPFEQSAPGAKCWFRKALLDAWRSS